MDENEEELQKERKELENQEVWAKVHFNGYFMTFVDMMVNAEIEIKESEKATRHLLFPAIDEKHGRIDITSLLHTFLHHLKENPGLEVKAYLTSFGRQFHFNKNLLSTPIPQSLIDLFGIK